MGEINLKRIEELVRGDQPVGLHEELFVVAFKSGLGGDSFMLTLLQVSDIFMGLTHRDKSYFCLGYALGQKTYLESQEQIEETFINNSNKTKH